MAEQVKLSDVRAQFPMYADLSDEQLLIGLRKKFYPDIPMADFVKRIDFDTQRQALQTEAAQASGPFLSGVGQGMTNLARGVGQALGMVSRDDVKESRRLDAGLGATVGGKVGNIVGTVAALAPTALIPGAATYGGAAAIGGGTGLLAPSASTGETLSNAALGGVAGPASIAAGRGLGALWQGGKGLVEPFTKAGQDKVAARVLQQFASDPKAAAAAAGRAGELVPGSVPTLAQATGDAGLAQLERSLAATPLGGTEMAARAAAQRAARLGAVQKIAGTEEYYQGIKEGISTFAKEDYKRAITEGFDPKALAANADKLNAILARPSVKSAQSTARELAAESGEELTSLGSVKGLDYLVKALDNQISAASGVGSSIGKEKLRALVTTKNDLTGLLGEIAPAYKEARQNFAQMAAQRNSMDAARQILERMQSPLGRAGASTNELRNEYARALEGAMSSIKRSTGQDVPLSKVMPAQDVAALEAVSKDMARATTAENLGRSVGSNTAQNLAAQNLLRRVMGPMGAPDKWAESNVLQAFLSPYTGVAKLGGAEQAVMDLVTRAVLDPKEAARLLLEAQKPEGRLAREALRYLPALSLAQTQK